MKEFDFTYADETVSNRELFIAVPSMVLAIGILSLPRTLTQTVPFVDGWISIFLAGILAALFALIVTKLALRFPGEQFFSYSEKIISKPITILLTCFYTIHFIGYASYESRMIAAISKKYILDQTPVEIISLVFVLLIAYAVSGSRAALLRLNMMFFPLVVGVLFLVLIFNYPFMDLQNLKPLFKADWKDILLATKETTFSFLGFEILLFYLYLLDKEDTKGFSKYPIIGMGIITLLYIVVFLVSVGTFSITGSQQVIYPTIELAKEVEVPGGIIEKIDPLFFTVWVMTIFNTGAMALDISVMTIQSIFSIKKKTVIFILLPIIYFASMLPQNHIQLTNVGTWIGYTGLVLGVIVPITLLAISHFRGVSSN